MWTNGSNLPLEGRVDFKWFLLPFCPFPCFIPQVNWDKFVLHLDGRLDFLLSVATKKYFYNIKPVKLIKVGCQNIKHSFLSNPLSPGRMQHVSFAGPKLPEVFKICRTLFHLWLPLPCCGRCLPPPTWMTGILVHSSPAKHATHPWKPLASSPHSCLSEIRVSVTHWH